MRLPSGRYQLVAVTPNPLPRCAPTSVNVKAGQAVHAVISCDTGIR